MSFCLCVTLEFDLRERGVRHVSGDRSKLAGRFDGVPLNLGEFEARLSGESLIDSGALELEWVCCFLEDDAEGRSSKDVVRDGGVTIIEGTVWGDRPTLDAGDVALGSPSLDILATRVEDVTRELRRECALATVGVAVVESKDVRGERESRRSGYASIAAASL